MSQFWGCGLLKDFFSRLNNFKHFQKLQDPLTLCNTRITVGVESSILFKYIPSQAYLK